MTHVLGVLVGVIFLLAGTLGTIGVMLMLEADSGDEWTVGLVVLLIGAALGILPGVYVVVRMVRRAATAERAAEVARQSCPSLVLRGLVEELSYVCERATSLDPFEEPALRFPHKTKLKEAVTRAEEQLSSIEDLERRHFVREFAKEVENKLTGGDRNKYAALDSLRQQGERRLDEWEEV
jgi:hypothetical protein